MIYFIVCRAANAVKIGVTDKRWRVTPLSAAISRLGQAQVNCPFELELRAVCEGGRAEEAALHQKFSEHRIRGEWFTMSPEVESLIGQLPVPPKLGRGWHFQHDHPARCALPAFPTQHSASVAPASKSRRSSLNKCPTAAPLPLPERTEL